jgi:hypothetical protein
MISNLFNLINNYLVANKLWPSLEYLDKNLKYIKCKKEAKTNQMCKT